MCFKGLVILLIVNIPRVSGQDNADSNEEVSKAFITLGILCGALIISLIIAKIVDWCYDRSTLRDDASDISEHTRKLIRARLAVMKFSKKELAKPVTNAHRMSRVIRIWSAKSKTKKISEIERNKDDIASKDVKHPLKVAFIDVPDENRRKTEKAAYDRLSPVTLQVPIEADVMVLEPADDASDTSRNLSELVLNVPHPLISNKTTTNTQYTNDVPELKIVSDINKLTLQKNGKTNTDSTPTQYTGPTNKIVPKNQMNSSTPAASPRTTSPRNKAKSVPHMNSRVVPHPNSPIKDLTENYVRSPSPPKILVKKPTEADFVPKLNTSSSKNAKTIIEKGNRQSKILTTQPRTMSAKSPRTISQRSHQPPTRSAPSERLLSSSLDNNAKSAHLKSTNS